MAEITLKREESMKILNNPDATHDARVIAACAMALFECSDDGQTAVSTRQIAHKLLRMSAAALDDAAEEEIQGERSDG
ncbi:hypothetical protein WMR10_001370 [Stenotrophomonas maltophilia]